MSNEKHKLLTKKYKEMFSRARAIVYKLDPMGITGDGDAPEDEYDMEIARILPLLSKQLSLDELSRQIGLVFDEYFGGDSSRSYDWYKPLAEALVEMMKEMNQK